MIAYLDCFSGVSGDMLLGAFVDALGCDQWLRDLAESVCGCEVHVTSVRRGAISACQVRVVTPAAQPSRDLTSLLGLVEQSAASAGARGRAASVLRVLASAEARVHGSCSHDVHLHEAGGLDAVVDILGACEAVELLQIDELFSSPLPLGGGSVVCAHGLIPIPAPAVVEILRGCPVAAADGRRRELVTPTGAALVVGLGCRFGPMPAAVIEKIGYGAGSHPGEPAGLPNALRVVIGRHSGSECSGDEVVVLEAGIDDMTPELLEEAGRRLLAAGAVEVQTIPAVMKKGRSGWLLSVVAPVSCRDVVVHELFTCTSTIGARERRCTRVVLDRRVVSVSTQFGGVRAKVASWNGAVVNVKPEHEDCVRLANEAGVSPKVVAAHAGAAASALYSDDVPRGTSDATPTPDSS